MRTSTEIIRSRPDIFYTDTIRNSFLETGRYAGKGIENWADFIRERTQADVASDEMLAMRRCLTILRNHSVDSVVNLLENELAEWLDEQLVYPLVEIFATDPILTAKFLSRKKTGLTAKFLAQANTQTS